MAFNYKPLFKLLIDHNMKKTDLKTVLGFGPSTVAKFEKGAILMDENQKLTYADKFADYEGQGIRPPTLEERAERKAKKEEEERRIAEKAKGIETYIPYVVRASSMEDEGEKYEVVKEMRKVHDEICRRLFDAGDESDLILVHVAAYDAARREILPPKSGSGKGRRMIRATNVYDDDDRPTTHYL